MKSNYTSPEIEVISVDATDILTASEGTVSTTQSPIIPDLGGNFIS